MNKFQIEAIGHLLSTYHNDLRYISYFQDFKLGFISPDAYVKKEDGSFYKFLIEFKVIRNIPKGTTIKLLMETRSWINGEQPNNVDGFAEHLKEVGLTHKLLKSMASKVLLLNNPWEIIPMDRLTRATLGERKNNYDDYLNKLEAFKSEHQKLIQSMVDYTKPLTDTIHRDYQNLKSLDIIAKNRMIDKFLWSGN